MRVVTICRWPGHIPANTESDELLSNMDFLPTFAHILNSPLPSERILDGKNFWPILAGESGAKTPHDHFYYFKGNNLEAVRSGPWKLILKNNELYNLKDDVSEAKNVASQHGDIVKKLQELAESTTKDLGTDNAGPNCRAPGQNPDPQPIINHDGEIRKEFQ